MSPCRSRVKPVSTLIHRRSFFVFAHGNFMGVYIHIYSSGGTLKFSKIMTQDMFFDNETTRMQTLKTPRKHVLPPGCNVSFGISNGCGWGRISSSSLGIICSVQYIECAPKWRRLQDLAINWGILLYMVSGDEREVLPEITL